VLERRGEYDPDVFLFVMRMDLKAALVVFPRSLTPDRLVESPNKLVKSGEYVFKVLLIEVLPLDLTKPLDCPLAMLNARRIREAYAHAVKQNLTLQAKRTILGGVDYPPYGMDKDEWERLHLEADQHHEPKPLRRCDHNDPSNHVIAGKDRHGRTRIICRQCTGVIRYEGSQGT